MPVRVMLCLFLLFPHVTQHVCYFICNKGYQVELEYMTEILSHYSLTLCHLMSSNSLFSLRTLKVFTRRNADCTRPVAVAQLMF